jgi:hypothetical protein
LIKNFFLPSTTWIAAKSAVNAIIAQMTLSLSL